MRKLYLIVVFVLLIGFNKAATLEQDVDVIFVSGITGLVEKYYVYGNHFNLRVQIDLDDVENVALVLYGQNIYEYPLLFTENQKFTLATKINKGIDLENLDIGEYQIFLRQKKGSFEYYKLENKTVYPQTVYYGMNNDNYLKKITITDNFKINVALIETPDDVYDIVIDPGHGGLDSGAVAGEYYERDLNLKYAEAIKQKLEKNGFRVKLTRDNNEDALPVYGNNGRVQYAYTTRAKLFFSLHFNSNSVTNQYRGLEIYVPNGIDIDFAKNLAKNIVETAGVDYSNFNLYKVAEGVYNRTLSSQDLVRIAESLKALDIEPYETPNLDTPYYFVLRETGGIVTNAYIDGRDYRREANPYYDANIAPEAYLIEFGYMNNKYDLSNILNKQEGYVKGFVKGIMARY